MNRSTDVCRLDAPQNLFQLCPSNGNAGCIHMCFHGCPFDSMARRSMIGWPWVFGCVSSNVIFRQPLAFKLWRNTRDYRNSHILTAPKNVGSWNMAWLLQAMKKSSIFPEVWSFFRMCDHFQLRLPGHSSPSVFAKSRRDTQAFKKLNILKHVGFELATLSEVDYPVVCGNFAR